MANNVVQIVVSAVTDAAERAVTSFKGSLKKLGGEAKSLLENRLVQGVGLAGLWAGLNKAIDASDALAVSTRKLEATAKITGVSLSTLQEIADTGRESFKLSVTASNDFAVELAKLASKAGDVEQAGPGLAAFLEIGAARGLSAAETLTAVQQSILGIDEGTDKLFGKNPSVLYKEYADKIGTTAGKLTDQQKAQALLSAAMDDGLKVQGEYGRYLESNAGKSEQMRQTVGELAAEFGDALQPARAFLLELGVKGVEYIKMFLGGVQLLAVDAAVAFHSIAPKVQDMKGKVLLALGELLTTAGEFVPFFGDKVASAGAALTAAGRHAVKEADDTRRLLKTYQDEEYRDILGNQDRVRRATSKHVAALTTTKTTSTEEDDKAAKKAHKEAEEQYDAHLKYIEFTLDRANKKLTDSIKSVTDTTRSNVEIFRQIVAEKVVQPTEEAQAAAGKLQTAFNDALGPVTWATAQTLTIQIRNLLKEVNGKVPTTEWINLNGLAQVHLARLGQIVDRQVETQEKARDWGREIGAIASGALGIANAFGLARGESAAVLQNVIGIATNIAKAFGGDVASIIAVTGNLANVIAGIGNSAAERKRLEAQGVLSQSVAKLAREVGNLALGATGRTFTGAESAVQAALKAYQDSAAKGGKETAYRAAERAFDQALLKQGVSKEEANALFRELLGKDIARANKQGFYESILAFSQALEDTEFGQYAQDAAGQLEAMQDAFELLNVSDDDAKLSKFKEYAKKFSPLVAQIFDAGTDTEEGRAAALAKIAEITAKLNDGSFKGNEAVFGDLRGAQVVELLKLLKPLIEGADGVGGLADVPATAAAAVAAAAAGLPGAPGLPRYVADAEGQPFDALGLSGGPATDRFRGATLGGSITYELQFGPGSIGIQLTPAGPLLDSADALARDLFKSLDRAIADAIADKQAAAGVTGVTVS